jgi:bifunctional DNA-binding transcriptional regulator/antitoxin component of YhaV-PrlF toxin-antitoxin module
MTTEVDAQGRIYLPKETRERYGDRFRLVELEDEIKLVPLGDDPVGELREALSPLADVPLDELRDQAKARARDDALR